MISDMSHEICSSSRDLIIITLYFCFYTPSLAFLPVPVSGDNKEPAVIAGWRLCFEAVASARTAGGSLGGRNWSGALDSARTFLQRF